MLFALPPFINGNLDYLIFCETKEKDWMYNLRQLESAKIECGEKHFQELQQGEDNPAKYIVANSVDEMMHKAENVDDDDEN